MTAKTLRDANKPAEHYRQLARAKQKESEFLLETADRADDPARRAGLLNTLPQKSNDIALALYSAGAPLDECRHWLSKAVDYRIRLAEARGFRFDEYGSMFEDLRTFSGARLIGRQAEVVAAMRRTVFDSMPVPGLVDLAEQYCQILSSEPLERVADEKSIKKAAPDWLTLPPLFGAVAARDAQRFTETLEQYLAASWQRYAKGLERAIKNPAPVYFGTWNLLSAALITIVGEMPNLSKKMQGFIPAELIDG